MNVSRLLADRLLLDLRSTTLGIIDASHNLQSKEDIEHGLNELRRVGGISEKLKKNLGCSKALKLFMRLTLESWKKSKKPTKK